MNAILKQDITLPIIGLIRAGTKLKIDFDLLIAFDNVNHFEIEAHEFDYLH
jgi:hypothetical protein